MMIDQVTNWCNQLREAWVTRDFRKVEKIFSKTTLYFEDPFTAPGTSSEEIRSYWEEIEFQEINELVIEPLVVADSRAALHWYLDYKDARDSSEFIMDGVYLVVFNDFAECISFRQWWVIKD